MIIDYNLMHDLCPVSLLLYKHEKLKTNRFICSILDIVNCGVLQT